MFGLELRVWGHRGYFFGVIGVIFWGHQTEREHGFWGHRGYPAVERGYREHGFWGHRGYFRGYRK